MKSKDGKKWLLKSLTIRGYECSHNANDQQRFNPNSEGILGFVRFGGGLIVSAR